MKKLAIALMMVFFLIGVAMADCTVSVSWVPSTSGDATQQQLIYFDGADEVVKATYANNTTDSGAFTIPAPITGDYVFVRTSNGTDTADSNQAMVGGVTPATGCTAIVICN